MDYTINITLSFSELIALDNALQHEAQKLASDECVAQQPIHNK